MSSSSPTEATGRTLADCEAELLRAVEEIDALSYAVSHDLRAPLRVIDGFSQAAIERAGDALSPEVQRYLGLVRRSAARMSAQLDGLLAYSRIGRREPELATVDMRTAARDATARVTADQEGGGVVVIGELPPAETDIVLVSDILDRLVDNAVKFSSHEETPHVEVLADATTDPVTYLVRDNGVGFDMRWADRLFVMYQRLHSDEEFDGLGLGLALAARGVGRLGGRIWADASVGQGATFAFTLAPDAPSDHR
ncbi:MAG: hypothetical protein JHC95_15460 [Solirubrobacteraceae bacterium]|nr:hypothetical protein [Solirubrobacteraceae bacterium]